MIKNKINVLLIDLPRLEFVEKEICAKISLQNGRKEN
jgi:hypothetical protein